MLSCKGKAEMDAQQWEQDATDKQQKVAELEAEVQKQQQELEERVNSFQVCRHDSELPAWAVSTARLLPVTCRQEGMPAVVCAGFAWQVIELAGQKGFFRLHGVVLDVLQADIAKAEAHAAELQQLLTASETRISSKSAELDLLQKQLEGVQQDLSKTAAVVTERDNKVGARAGLAGRLVGSMQRSLLLRVGSLLLSRPW